MRSRADGATTFFSQASTHFNIIDWRLRIGSQVVPYKAANTMIEHYAELIKAIGSLVMHIMSQQSIDILSFNSLSEHRNITGHDSENFIWLIWFFGSGLIVRYANSDKDKFFAGMNTLNSDIYWNMNFGANAWAPHVKFDFYALSDNVLVFENGICYSKRDGSIAQYQLIISP
jgi:hypothetical protein